MRKFISFFLKKSKSNGMGSIKECIEVIESFGFKGSDSLFTKGDCFILIMEDKIKLWYNIPGIDKEYIGPPLPSKDQLRKFVKENTF